MKLEMTPKQQVRIEQWSQIIGECQASGLPIRKWCLENGVKESSYYHYLKKIRCIAFETRIRSTPSETIPVSANIPAVIPRQDVVELQLDREYTTSTYESKPPHFVNPALKFDICGISVNIFAGADVVTIKNTLSAIQSLC